MGRLSCQMDSACTALVTHLDNKGYVYCKEHGLDRRGWRPCRALRKWELRQLEKGEPLKCYAPQKRPLDSKGTH